jgi:predicted acetyltransferase
MTDVDALQLVAVAEPLSNNKVDTFAAFQRAAADADAEAAFDRQMRELLTASFPKEAKFKTQRFNNEMPTRRFLLLDADGAIAAHVAVHEKRLVRPNGDVEMYTGIAEVFTAERFRKRGLVKRLLAYVHTHYAAQGFQWSILMAGSSAYYVSSGYISVENVQAFDDDPHKQFHHPMVRSLLEPATPWHSDDRVVLNCPYF